MLRDLTPERWRQISTLLDEAQVHSPSERATYLDGACNGDARLRAYVERLIHARDRAEQESASCAVERFRELLSDLSPAEDSSAAPGELLTGRYRLEREIGRGAAATVHLARDLERDQPVAVKVLEPRLARSVARERFTREIRLASTLTHRNIVPLYDDGIWEETLYYVMPYIEGESLRQRLERETTIAPEETCRLAAQVADALDHAHREGVVHRDIKPENVLLRGGDALVADFGVARALSASADLPALTAAGFAVGTPAYMSPEQLSGAKVDRRSDIYALGCVVFEMLVGERPLIGKSVHQIMRRRLGEDPPDPLTHRPEVPAALAAAVRRALARSPDARFATAAEMARALRAVPR